MDQNRRLSFVFRWLFLYYQFGIEPNLLDKTGVNLIRYPFSQCIFIKVLAGLITDSHHYNCPNNW
jgi:hypothetical protein